MSRLEDWASAVFNPSPLGFFIALLLVITIPLFLHSFVFRASGLTTLPSFLLLGPSGTGKTSLLTLLERGQNAATHTSQTPIAVECLLPVGTSAASSKYRSVNDPSNLAHKKFLLIDTPGHGKLRNYASDSITKPQNLKGVIFLLDAANMSSDDEGLRQTTEYLRDVLLFLQKRMTNTKSSKAPQEIPVLIAANKMDLFTALPAALVKSALETELSKIRTSRSKGLLDSGIGMSDTASSDDTDDWLGETGSTIFKFQQMEEFNMSIEVAGGNVIGTDGARTEKWWSWIAERL